MEWDIYEWAFENGLMQYPDNNVNRMGFYDNMMGIYMANNTVCVFFFLCVWILGFACNSHQETDHINHKLHWILGKPMFRPFHVAGRDVRQETEGYRRIYATNCTKHDEH